MLKARSEERVIGDVKYIVQPLPGGMSLKVMCRVLKMAAPSFGDVASLREAAGAVGRAFSGLMADIDEDVLTFACNEFAKGTTFEQGTSRLPLADVFDMHFQGRLVELLEWLRFAAEVTYGPLVRDLEAKAKASAGATPAAG